MHPYLAVERHTLVDLINVMVLVGQYYLCISYAALTTSSSRRAMESTGVAENRFRTRGGGARLLTRAREQSHPQRRPLPTRHDESLVIFRCLSPPEKAELMKLSVTSEDQLTACVCPHRISEMM